MILRWPPRALTLNKSETNYVCNATVRRADQEENVGDPDIEHWHGASPGSALTHVVITNYKGDSQGNWLRPVTEEEYTAAAK